MATTCSCECARRMNPRLYISAGGRLFPLSQEDDATSEVHLSCRISRCSALSMYNCSLDSWSAAGGYRTIECF